jgi:hypothetical protein
MGVQEGHGVLTKAMHDLLAQWQELRTTWDDAVAREFEEKYLVPLQKDLRTAAGAMDQMAVLMHKIHNDCA